MNASATMLRSANGHRASRRFLALALALSCATGTHVASAQPQPNPDMMKEIARQRYTDGVKAFDAGKFDEARAAFSQAYELTKVPTILLNLGLSEIKANHPVEGGNHLLQFLREAKEAKPESIASAKQALEEAKRKAAQVSITVNIAGADLSVDGTLVGKSPMTDPVFVEAGSRTIVASFNGNNGMARVDAKKGAVADASIVIAGAVPAEQPKPQPPVGPTDPAQPPVGPTGPTGPTQPPVGPTQPPTQPADGGRESFGHWYAHKPLAWVGTGLAAVGLGMGIGFTAAASSANANTEALALTIRTDLAIRNVKTAPCSNSGGADVPRYAKACTALRDSMSKHDLDVGLGVAGWVAFGIGTVGTVTYVLVDWLPSKKSQSAAGFLYR